MQQLPSSPMRGEGHVRYVPEMTPILTIDLGAIRRNWRALDALSGTAETGAAVKADAYGCGLAPVATALHAEGCRTFFVATLDEGIALRAALPDATAITLTWRLFGNGGHVRFSDTPVTQTLCPPSSSVHKVFPRRS